MKQPPFGSALAADSALARALAGDRHRFNEAVATARRRWPDFDTDAFGAFLADATAPFVEAASHGNAMAAARLTQAAFDAAILLVAHGRIGAKTGDAVARSAAVGASWRALAGPLHMRLGDAEVAATLALITHATLSLLATPGTQIDVWRDRMTSLGPAAADHDALRRLGQVLAWRAGMAHFRRGALEAAARLPESLALAATGAQGAWPQVHARLLADPWWTPGDEPAARRQIGAFVGFGGSFRRPPELRAVPDGFLVDSGDRCAWLAADAFGAVFVPSSREAFLQAPEHCSARTPPRVDKGALQVDQQAIALNLPEQGLRVASNEHSVAIASPWTYSIQLLPRPYPAAAA